jgi:hypothetical protein
MFALFGLITSSLMSELNNIVRNTKKVLTTITYRPHFTFFVRSDEL